jgi:alkylhydroperoxidase family enzyme
MAWIKVVEEEEAEGELKETYERIKRQRSMPRVGNVLKLHSLNPRALSLGADFMWWLMRGESGLSAPQREMIATVVSATLQCRY